MADVISMEDWKNAVDELDNNEDPVEFISHVNKLRAEVSYVFEGEEAGHVFATLVHILADFAFIIKENGGDDPIEAMLHAVKTITTYANSES
jgi:hypothetical protein